MTSNNENPFNEKEEKNTISQKHIYSFVSKAKTKYSFVSGKPGGQKKFDPGGRKKYFLHPNGNPNKKEKSIELTSVPL